MSKAYTFRIKSQTGKWSIFNTFTCVSYFCFVNLIVLYVFFFTTPLILLYNLNGAGSTYLPGSHEFTPVFSGVRCARSLVFCVVFCRSLFVLFLLAIVLSFLPRFTDSNYSFCIFNLLYYIYIIYHNTTDLVESIIQGKCNIS